MEQSDMSLAVSLQSASGLVEWSSNTLFQDRSTLLDINYPKLLLEMRRFEKEVNFYLNRHSVPPPEKSEAAPSADDANPIPVVAAEEEDAVPRSLEADETTLGDFLKEKGFSDFFTKNYVVPMCGSIWSCGSNACLKMPCGFLFSFMRNHHLLQLPSRPQWLTVKGRTQNGYIAKVVARIGAENFRLNNAVRGIEYASRPDQPVHVTDSAGVRHAFDGVIIAAHAPDTLALLSNPSARAKELLGGVSYQDNEIYLHQDASRGLMPRSKTNWAAWNFCGEHGESKNAEAGSSTRIQLTYWLNLLQNLGDAPNKLPILVTLNPGPDSIPAQDLTLSKFHLAHPLFSTSMLSAVRGVRRELQGEGGVFFAGAWLRWGFHEDGFISGVWAANAVIGQIPVRRALAKRDANGVVLKAVLNLQPKPTIVKANIRNFNDTASLLSTGARYFVMRYLRTRIKVGGLLLREVGGTVERFGDPSIQKPITLWVTSPNFYTRVSLRGDLGFADAIIAGELTSTDPQTGEDSMVDLMILLIRNLQEAEAREEEERWEASRRPKSICSRLMQSVATRLAPLSDFGIASIGLGAAQVWQAWTTHNTPAQSRVNISAHYDTGNEFFKLFLCSGMNYSSALYDPTVQPPLGECEDEDAALSFAQTNKLDHLLTKARIPPAEGSPMYRLLAERAAKRGDSAPVPAPADFRALEIGFGWGSLSIRAAQLYGVRVHGLTLSVEQHAYATARVAALGLSQLVTYEVVDYRVFATRAGVGRFQRILSCEMLEAVGHDFFPAFYGAVEKLLDLREGVLVVQAITYPDFRYDAYRSGTDFIREKIFPGGLLPSLTALSQAAGSVRKSPAANTIGSGAKIVQQSLTNMGIDYARTLRAWRHRLARRQSDALAQGYSMPFLRKWDYYFAYCEAAFLARAIDTVQIVYSRVGNNAVLDRPMHQPADLRQAAAEDLKHNNANVRTAYAIKPLPINELRERTSRTQPT
jgi:cyclopropane-fatty-acyl-phospholipid synthase